MKANNLACNCGTAFPTKSYRVVLSIQYNVQGVPIVDITRSLMDAPLKMVRYTEPLLYYTFEEYVCMNVLNKLVGAIWQSAPTRPFMFCFVCPYQLRTLV